MLRFTHILVFLAICALSGVFFLDETKVSIASIEFESQVVLSDINYRESVPQIIVEAPHSFMEEVTVVNKDEITEIQSTPIPEGEQKEHETSPPDTTEVFVVETAVPEVVIEPAVVIDRTQREDSPVEVGMYGEVVNEIHRLTNRSRIKNNEHSLSLDTELSRLATVRSLDMVQEDYFGHTNSAGCDTECRFLTSGYDSMSWGENIAEFEPYTKKDTDSLASIFVRNWLESRGHRENILSPEFTHEGIGVAIGGGRIVVTVIFASPEQ